MQGTTYFYFITRLFNWGTYSVVAQLCENHMSTIVSSITIDLSLLCEKIEVGDLV
jgi:hypothetical protein